MDAAGSAAPGTPLPAPSLPPTVTLRLFLDGRAAAAFPHSTETRLDVADVPVNCYEIDLRLAAMRRALMAHQSLNTMLSQTGVVDLPTKLIDSIHMTESLGITDHQQGKWLRHFNQEANEAKHGRGLPF